MLDPQDRTLLRDALRPPQGFALDRAIVTTFSLDLTALLTVPFSFTVFQLKDQAGPLAVDPLALLEALRRYARRMTVFCQAGQIHSPKQGQVLLGYLETSVVEVTSPRGGVFHPKLTVLRYVATDADERKQGSAVVYRVLCSSRNLTFDRSWDTLLVLEGSLGQHRKNAYARNRPLARFVRALPELALNQPNGDALVHVHNMADELLRVEFGCPDGFDDFAFCPVGVDGGEDWPVLGHRRTLTVAPFAQEGFIERLTANGGDHQLVSRIETFDGLSSEAIGPVSAAWYMNPAADPASRLEEEQLASAETAAETGQATVVGDENNAGDSGGDRRDADPLELTPANQLSGLHAKLFIADDGGRAHIWTGSANATEAAFERNVEFLVRLTGKRSRCGVGTFAPSAENGGGETTEGRDRATTFADLLLRYERVAVPATDTARQELERILDETRYLFATARIRAHIEPLADGSPTSRYGATLIRTPATPLRWSPSVLVACHPVTLPATAAIRLTAPLTDAVAAFAPLSFEALTSFYAFRLTARRDATELTCGFVLNLPLTGAPADREGRILLGLLRNRDQLLRYLLMVLAGDDEAAAQVAEILGTDQQRHNDGQGRGFGLPFWSRCCGPWTGSQPRSTRSPG